MRIPWYGTWARSRQVIEYSATSEIIPYENEWIYVGSQSSSYTAALAIHRVTDDILVMSTGNGTNDGQIFRSTDAGRNWTQVTSITGVNQIGTFTTISSTGRILAGCGPAPAAAAQQSIFRIYYSDDQGLTWSDLGAVRDGGNLLAITELKEIEDGILLMGGVREGIWKSTDGGLNWVNKYDSDARYSSNFNILSDGTYLAMRSYGTGSAVLFSSSDKGESWSSVYTFANNEFYTMKVLNNDVIVVGSRRDGTIWKSTDLGTSFTEIYDFSDLEELTRFEYDPDGDILYVCGNDSADSNGYVYQSTDQGDTWEFCVSTGNRYMNGLAIIPNYRRALSCGGEQTTAVWTNKEYEGYNNDWFVTEDFGYAQTLSIDRSDSGTILCSYGTGGVSSSAHIARSTDSGETWTDVGYSTSSDQIQSISYVGNNEGNETWIATLGQGWTQVIQSTDDGLTWTSVFNAGSRTYKTFSIGDGICFAGGRDFGDYIWRSTDYGATFTQVKGDSGRNNIEDFVQTPNGDIYAVSSYGSGGAGLYKSTDSGATWSLIYTTTGGEDYRSITAISDTKLLMGTDVEQIYESTDSGVTWSLLSTTPNASDDIFSLEYDSDNDKLFMGSGDASQLNNGAIWSSDDQGATWTQEQHADDQCTDILLIPSELRVLACQGRGSGESWIWTNTSYS
jgi:photosystem II stability/assembly factor-like uncharacterized protein